MSYDKTKLFLSLLESAPSAGNATFDTKAWFDKALNAGDEAYRGMTEAQRTHYFTSISADAMQATSGWATIGGNVVGTIWEATNSPPNSAPSGLPPSFAKYFLGSTALGGVGVIAKAAGEIQAGGLSNVSATTAVQGLEAGVGISTAYLQVVGRAASVIPGLQVLGLLLSALALYMTYQDGQVEKLALAGAIEKARLELLKYSPEQRVAMANELAQIQVQSPDAATLAYVRNTYTAYAKAALQSFSDQELADFAAKSIPFQQALLAGAPLPSNPEFITHPAYPQGYVVRGEDFWLARAQLYRQFVLRDGVSDWTSREALAEDVPGLQVGQFGNVEFRALITEPGVPIDLSLYLGYSENVRQTLFASSEGSIDGGNLDDKLFGDSGSNAMSGDEGGDILKGYEGDDILKGEAGSDILWGGADSDVLDGGADYDELRGGSGDDWLGYSGASETALADATQTGDHYWGGRGADRLAGTAGNDSYYYRRGDGVDKIVTGGGSDSLVLGQYLDHEDPNYLPDFLVEEVSFRKIGEDLEMSFSSEFAQQDKVVVQGWFKTEGDGQLAEVTLGAKTWTRDEITEKALTQQGSEQSDILMGFGGFKNTLLGNGGDDILTGATTPGRTDLGDTFVGGEGADTISGTSSSDKYLYSAGEGRDTITEVGGVFDELTLSDISAANTTFYRLGDDLVADFGTRKDSVTFNNWYANDAYKVESVRFGSDGAVGVSTLSQITGIAIVDDGSGYLNSDWSSPLNEVFIGGSGNDYISTGWGKTSTILFGQGDGRDTVYLEDNSVVRIGEGLSSFNVSASRHGAVKVSWASGESITFQNIDSPWSNGSFLMRLATGQQYDARFLVNALQNVSTAGNDLLHANASYIDLLAGGGSDELWGNGASQTLEGGAGDDHLYGNGGQDTYIGGAGNDMLYSDVPNQGSTFQFGRGSDIDNLYLYNNQSGKTDTLRIVGGITKTDLTFSKQSTSSDSRFSDLHVTITDTGDTFIVRNFLNGWTERGSAIDRILFDNGSVMSYSEIRQAIGSNYDPTTILGTENSDNLSGNGVATKIFGLSDVDWVYGHDTLAETLDGGADGDFLFGHVGDTLIGGTGDDQLNADGADVTIEIDATSGHDLVWLNDVTNATLRVKGLSPASLSATFEGTHLVLSSGATQVTVYNYLNGQVAETTRNFSTVVFDEGVSWTAAELLAKANYDPYTIKGTIGSDNLSGNGVATAVLGLDGVDWLFGDYSSAETLDGGADGDFLFGHYGDTLIGGTGNDELTADGADVTVEIDALSGQDKVWLTGVSNATLRVKSLSPANLTATFEGTALVLSSGTTRLTVYNYLNGRFADTTKNFTTVVFDEGVSWTAAELLAKANYDPYALRGTSSADRLTGDGTATKLLGLAGQDYLFGNQAIVETLAGGSEADFLFGNNGDTLIGGTGNDELYGSVGNEAYLWSAGDGMDRVFTSGGQDVFEFADLTDVTNLTVSRSEGDLVLTAGGVGGGARFSNWFQGYNQVTFKLPDGTEWSASRINAQLRDAKYATTFQYSDIALSEAQVAFAALPLTSAQRSAALSPNNPFINMSSWLPQAVRAENVTGFSTYGTPVYTLSGRWGVWSDQNTESSTNRSNPDISGYLVDVGLIRASIFQNSEEQWRVVFDNLQTATVTYEVSTPISGEALMSQYGTLVYQNSRERILVEEAVTEVELFSAELAGSAVSAMVTVSARIDQLYALESSDEAGSTGVAGFSDGMDALLPPYDALANYSVFVHPSENSEQDAEYFRQNQLENVFGTVQPVSTSKQEFQLLI